MKTQEEMIEAGEYCGVCGTVAKTPEEYEERKARAWFCSEEHDNQSREEREAIRLSR